MKTVRIKMWTGMMAVLLMALTLSCQEAANNASPVELVATILQERHIVDLADPDCGNLALVTLRNLIKRPEIEVDPRLLDVVVRSYRVSYQRTDGGTQVPAPFTRSTTLLVPAGGLETELGSFLAFESGAFNQAPFVALRSANGGTDPETGRNNITMDLIIDFFGETLSGEEVSARGRMGVTFCISCGGCV